MKRVRNNIGVWIRCGRRRNRPPRSRVEKPAHSRGAASSIAQGERYSANPGVAGILGFFIVRSRHWPNVKPSHTYGGPRRMRFPCGIVGSRIQRMFGLGQWRPRTGIEEKETRNPGLAEYRSPWATVDAAPRLIPGTFNARPGKLIHRVPHQRYYHRVKSNIFCFTTGKTIDFGKRYPTLVARHWSLVTF